MITYFDKIFVAKVDLPVINLLGCFAKTKYKNKYKKHLTYIYQNDILFRLLKNSSHI